MCDKVTYTSRNAAASAIAALQKVRHKRHSRNQPSTTYFCTDCNGWHVTSKRSKLKVLPHREKVISIPEIPQDEKRGRLMIKDFTNARFQISV